MDISLQKGKQSRVVATVVYPADLVSDTEESVIRSLGSDLSLKGFRAGKAPLEMLRSQLSEQRIHEELVHRLLPETMKSIVEEHDVQPIIRPRVELSSLDPLTVILTLVTQPDATVKQADKLQKLVAQEEKKRGPSDKPKKTEEEKKEMDEDTKKQWEAYEQRQAREEREKIFFDVLAEKTSVDLASELIDEETRDMVEMQAQQLQQYGASLESWLEQKKMSIEDYFTQTRPDAEKRIKIRFGLQYLIKEWEISVSDEQLQQSIQSFVQGLPADYQQQVAPLYEKGGRNYEQFRQQKMVDAVLAKVLDA